MNEKIILFYKYIPISNPEEIVAWQKALCAQLQLKGRVLIAKEGINATLGGDSTCIEIYKTAMNEHALFGNIDFKESPGGAECFPKMQVTHKPSILHFAQTDDNTNASLKQVGGHLSPLETHTLITENPNDMLIFDARNNYESRIGKFTNAITPNINNFRELPDFIDANLDLFKDKQVLMYCTGGVRCERASAYLQQKQVAKQVMQMNGGIHRYVEEYPDGFFRGKNYVFDGRIAVRINDDIIAHCLQCGIAQDEYTHCLDATCNEQYIACEPCIAKFNNCCSIICQKRVATKKTYIRAPLKKISIKATE